MLQDVHVCVFLLQCLKYIEFVIGGQTQLH